MTDEAATAHWWTGKVQRPIHQPKIISGGQRIFESVPNAVRFIMEDLLPRQRSEAWITTASVTIEQADIERMYVVRK